MKCLSLTKAFKKPVCLLYQICLLWQKGPQEWKKTGTLNHQGVEEGGE